MRIAATFLPDKGHRRNRDQQRGRIGVKLIDIPQRHWDLAVDKVRSIPGARWRKAERIWTLPATVDTCHALRANFPNTLEVSEALAEWYLAHRHEAEESALAAEQSDAQLVRVPEAAPALFATLRPDQRAGAAWWARGYRGGGILADEPGLGKTLEAIAGTLEADVRGPVLVVCPRLSVKRVWQRELNRWAPDEHVHICRGTRRTRERALERFMADPAERKWLVIVAEMLRVKREPPPPGATKAMKKKRGRVIGYEYPDLFDGERTGGWAAVIADESHRLLGSLSVVKSNLMGEGLALLPLRSDRLLRAVTGTPFGRGGRVYGMFGTLHWMWRDEYTSFWRWAEHHFEVEVKEVQIKGARRGMTRTTRKIGKLRDGRSGEEFLATLGPRIMRRTKLELLPDLPPKQFVTVECELEGAQLKQYQQLSLEAEVVVPGGVIMANGVLAERTRARQLANGAVTVDAEGKVGFDGASCKVDNLMAILEEQGILDGSSDKKVLVASQWNEFLYGAVLPALDKAECPYHLLTGKTSDRQRDEMMDAWQAPGGPQVFVLNAKAGGISVTLDAGDDVHQLDRLDNPEDEQQLYDRVHRASRVHQVTIYRYESVGTIDTNVADAVGDKEEEQFEVLDGRRGLEFLRKCITYQPPKGD